MCAISDALISGNIEHPELKETFSKIAHECDMFEVEDGYCANCGRILQNVIEEQYGINVNKKICDYCD